MKILTFLFVVLCLSCSSNQSEKPQNSNVKESTEVAFDKEKWNTKDGNKYPYRDKMADDIINDHTIRDKSKEEILELLGEPSYYRDDPNYLYYTISRKQLFTWTLHAKTMVIKFSEDNSLDWIKIHE